MVGDTWLGGKLVNEYVILSVIIMFVYLTSSFKPMLLSIKWILELDNRS